ncbi:MAG: AraC family transcriptional regulator [Lachnospiraceae bacterium]|jgi:AraC-like DNA-binding protein|nr:AraC family transcriptional regulator [Lachnospiraceae bacterium]MCI9601294.1 AraC family transcriptional regulator [Lachnospiraceae bacterium]
MVDIANRLSFSSQSHFIQQFREYVGMTPKKYRDLNHMIQWDIVTETKEDKSGNEGVP